MLHPEPLLRETSPPEPGAEASMYLKLEMEKRLFSMPDWPTTLQPSRPHPTPN